MKKDNMFKLISTAIIAVAIVGAARLFTKTDVYIKDISGGAVPGNMAQNTLSVEGEGEVFATPDTILLNIQVSELKKTTQEAQTAINEKTNEIKDLLKKYEIETKDIQTSNVSMNPEYDYSKDTGRELEGYRARHTLNIKIKEIDGKNKDKAGKFIDDISKIGDIKVQNISYDIEDKTPFYSEARKLAMAKAKQKAQEIAKVAEVKLLKPMSISENVNNYYPPMPMLRNTYAMEAKYEADMGGGGSISEGQLQINLTVHIVYGIE